MRVPLLWGYVAAFRCIHALNVSKANIRGAMNYPRSKLGNLIIENATVQNHRVLVSDHNNFLPLSCNQDACSAGTSTWTTEGYDLGRTVVIPCGRCVTMDYGGDLLVLPLGLDVQGSLFFPDGYKLQMETTFVRVQGNLHMRATKSVTEEPNVRILLTSTGEGLNDFVPTHNNQLACTPHEEDEPEECHVGNKPIVVAGGRLDIQGLPDGCKTWVQLHGLVTSNETPSPESNRLPELDPGHVNPYCRSYNPYVQESFSANSEWTGGYGARFRVTSAGLLTVWDRKSSTEHGPTLDLLPFRECLVPNQTYLFSCRVRLVSSATGLTTSIVKRPGGKLSRPKGQETNTDAFVYGEWQPFYSTFSFSPQELDQDAIYHLLRLEGPETDVDIEVDDVQFSLPPEQQDSACTGNLIRNGDAQASAVHPFPMEASRGSRLSVYTVPNGTSFFRSDLRTSVTDSIVYPLSDPDCLVPGARYKVGARVRIMSQVQVESLMVFRAMGKSPTRFVIAKCPPSQGNSVTCVSEFIAPHELDGAERIQLSFETLEGSLDTMEVDNWELEFVQGPAASILVQEDGILGCWDKGAEILITSHTTDLESSQVRRLMSTPESMGNGLVRLDLHDVIVPPVTVEDGDGFAVEVALLSRNIVFAGAADESDSLLGGHLIVLHTPGVPQKIEGVELQNFGRQGKTQWSLLDRSKPRRQHLF
jgi:hypothetical protein